MSDEMEAVTAQPVITTPGHVPMAVGKPPRSVVVEHAATLPMLLAVILTALGALVASGMWSPTSPTFKIMAYVCAALPTSIALLGQLWKSFNTRAQMAGAVVVAQPVAAAVEPNPMRLSDEELEMLEAYRTKKALVEEKSL